MMKNRNLLYASLIAISLILSGCAAKTPLIKASQEGDALAVQQLISQGANINEPDSKGYTPLMYAAWSGKYETVKYLIDKGADINAKDSNGYTSLLWATSYGYFDIAKLLIDKGADVNAGDDYKRTPLMNAVPYENNMDIIKLLIERGADVNARDYAGFTALMYASSPTIVGMLIDRGADAYAKNNEGYTVLQDAIYNKNIEKVAIIRQKTNYKEQTESESLSAYEALKTPSYYKPELGAFDVPPGKELAYNTAVYDCNHLSITGKTGLLIATGPVGYLAGVAFDAVTVPSKFKNCMQKMGFQYKNNGSGNVKISNQDIEKTATANQTVSKSVIPQQQPSPPPLPKPIAIPPPLPPEEEWWVGIDGRKEGPLKTSKIKELLSSGKITYDTLIWKDGMKDWKMVSNSPFAKTNETTVQKMSNINVEKPIAQ